MAPPSRGSELCAIACLAIYATLVHSMDWPHRVLLRVPDHICTPVTLTAGVHNMLTQDPIPQNKVY